MKTIKCHQGSHEWFVARLGKPTASGFGDIITPEGKLKTGKTPRTYALELLAERLTQLPTQTFVTDAMRRGTELEPKARQWYEFSRGVTVEQVGICLTDDGKVGGSPDGLLQDRGIEIKCPMSATFMDIVESGTIPDDHMMQMQGLMWITGLPMWDYVVYTDLPGLIPQVYSVQADQKIQAALSLHMPAFVAKLDEMESRLRSLGHGNIAAKAEADAPTWEELTNMVTA